MMTKKMSVENNRGGATGPELQHETVLWTSKDVADFLRLNTEHFRNRYRNGKLVGFPDAVKFGVKRLWWRDEVVAWVKMQREGVPSGA